MVRRFSFIPGMAEHLRGTVVDAGEDERPLVSGNQVVVGNAPAATSPESIREFFRSCGEVIGLRQLDGGDLLLTFQDEDGVSTALMEDGVEYKGAQLTVNKAERKTGLIQGRTVSMISSVLNLLNAIVGAGTLCMAYTMQGSGIVLFLVLLFVMVLIIDYSLQMMLAAASTTLVKGQMVSYERLGALAWGEKGRILVSGMILLQNTGAMVTYFKVFKDVIPDIMVLVVDNPDSHFRDANFMTSLAAAIVFFPACSPTVGMLSYVGAVAIFLTAFFVVFVMIKYHALPQSETCACPTGFNATDPLVETVDAALSYSKCGYKMFAPSIQTFLALPTISFAFVCHTSVLPVFHELQLADEMGRTKRSKKRIMKVVHLALIIAFIFYSLAATFGYLTFRDRTNQDLLENYGKIEGDNKTPWSITVRLAFMCAVVSSIPLLIFPYRRSLDNLHEAYERLHGREPVAERTGLDFWWRHVLKTAVIIVVMLMGALYVQHITTIFSTVGATSSVSLVFILPSALYMKLCLGEENLDAIRRKGSVLGRERGQKPSSTSHLLSGDCDPEEGTPLCVQDETHEAADPPPLAKKGPMAVFALGVIIFIVSWTGNIYLWVDPGAKPSNSCPSL